MEPYNWSQHEPTILNDVWCWVLATEVKENNHKVMPFKFKINACPMHELQQDLTWRGDDASLISQLLYFAARAWRWFRSAWKCLYTNINSWVAFVWFDSAWRCQLLNVRNYIDTISRKCLGSKHFPWQGNIGKKLDRKLPGCSTLFNTHQSYNKSVVATVFQQTSQPQTCNKHC